MFLNFKETIKCCKNSIQKMQRERIERDYNEELQEQHAAYIAAINNVASDEVGEVAEIEFTAKKALKKHDCNADWKTCECTYKYCHCDALPSDMQ
jgi:hypothetical protein